MSAAPILKAPFPYFGGKRKIADLVWDRFGNVDNYVEPFCGSAVMLLCRPTSPRIETLNDMNCYVANFWRATQRDPVEVAGYADAPVNEVDLHARHRWLMLSETSAEFRNKMRTDPDYCDTKIAGWWCWGICCWIGGGWCVTDESSRWEQRPVLDGIDRGVHGQAPTMEQCRTGGKGVHGVGPRKKRPFMSHDGTGVHGVGPAAGRRSFLSRPGQSIHMDDGLSSGGRPQLADAYARGRGVHGHDVAITCQDRREWLVDWFSRLRDRLRTVRVLCGDWKRVCGSTSVTTRLGTTGIFLDPPYKIIQDNGEANRHAEIYANDRHQNVSSLVDEVRAYCQEHGPDPRFRIALCGLTGEGHEILEKEGWEVVAWRSSGYQNASEKGKTNSERERVWFSPGCLKSDRDYMPLFGI